MVSAQLDQVRLVTLIGPGGVGKTSVALAVGHHDVERWAEDPVFVDLVPARTAVDVLRTVADALGVEGDAARSSDELGAHLADRSMLIVLDNCEHVIDPAAELVDAALACGGPWRVLATSREPLGLGDEHLVPVEPLGAAAAELFVERARRLEPRTPWDAVRSTRSSSSAPASTGCRSPSSWPPGRCAGGACPSCAAASTTPRTACRPGPPATNPGTAR